jgi:hypothetical protein
VSEDVAERLMNWLRDPAAHAETVAELAGLRRTVVEPGASARTARYILDQLGAPSVATRRAA